MDLLSNLALGMSVALSWDNLLFCLIGTLLGTLIGVLPGVGPVATIAMLLPVTYTLTPTGALIMLSGIYYGAQYGGSTTAILVNIPGETSSVVTCLDGHPMAQQGRAGPALAIAALGSFFAGCVATIVIVLVATPLVALAMAFGPAEYFSLMILGLVLTVVLARGSPLKAIAMILFGVLLSLVGTDVHTGDERLTYGIPLLAGGLSFVPLAMGIFGLSEIISNLEKGAGQPKVKLADRISGLMPTWVDLKASAPAVLRGTGLGVILGVLPGASSAISSFASYALEKKIAKDPSRFGKGAIEGVAGPESANNAGAQTSFIPMLTLGIPANSVMALMIGAMMIQGIQPGPMFMTAKPDLFWAVIASMWIGNAMLVVINLPLIGIWVRLLDIPYWLLFPGILLFCAIGVFSLNNEPGDVVLAAISGLFGYLLLKLGCEPAPLLLGFVLGRLMEENLRRAMLLSRGDVMVFVTNPISAVLLGMALVLIIAAFLPSINRGREKLVED
jgi:putative tricarboxylic transport membrane protein